MMIEMSFKEIFQKISAIFHKSVTNQPPDQSTDGQGLRGALAHLNRMWQKKKKFLK